MVRFKLRLADRKSARVHLDGLCKFAEFAKYTTHVAQDLGHFQMLGAKPGLPDGESTFKDRSCLPKLGPTEQVLEHPSAPYTQQLLANTPSIAPVDGPATAV